MVKKHNIFIKMLFTLNMVLKNLVESSFLTMKLGLLSAMAGLALVSCQNPMHPFNVLGEEYRQGMTFKKTSPIVIKNKQNLVLDGIMVSNPNGICIKLKNVKNVTIKNSWITSCKGEGVHIIGSENVFIEETYFEGISTGVYALDSKNIVVANNEIKNVQGPFPRGQAVQFDKVFLGQIAFNYVVNVSNESFAEDAINLYESNGTLDLPIDVYKNYIRGGGPSDSGGGILLGDNGGSYQRAVGNILENPGQYGIGVASGRNIHVEGNSIYGKKQFFTNTGLYVWNQYDASCENIVIEDNSSYFINKNGSPNHFSDLSDRPKHNYPKCKNVSIRNNSFGNTKDLRTIDVSKNIGITNWSGPLSTWTP